MELHNYMEDVTFEMLETLLEDKKDICKCEKCKLDAAAISLNALSPKYVVTSKGRVYAKLKELELQFQTDVVKELAKALDIVRKKPQH